MAQPNQGQPGQQGPPPGYLQPPPGFQLQPGQQPSPEQIRQIQAQIATEAQKAGLTVPQYVERIKAQAAQERQQMIAQRQAQFQAMTPEQRAQAEAQMRAQMQARMQNMTPEQRAQAEAQMRAQMQAQMQKMTPEQRAQAEAAMRAQTQGPQAAQPGQQVPIAPGPPKPEGLAVAGFLRGQDLKLRTCILDEKRRDMFKVKRAIRALQSPAYEKARKKNPLLPEVKDRVTAENTFKMLPISMLALRVSKIDPHEGHAHAKPKKHVKGLWTVKIEPQQEARDDFHYVWLYEGSQWKRKLYAGGALALILAVVFFPLWPYYMRLGVWYLSMGMLGLLGLFFAMAIFRLILFLVTMFAVPPGFWLYPNLFEDVGFFDSFKPLWAWHEDEKTTKMRKKEERQKKKARKEAKADGGTIAEAATAAGEKIQDAAAAIAPSARSSEPAISQPVTASTTGSESVPKSGNMQAQQRNMTARVEEVEDE